MSYEEEDTDDLKMRASALFSSATYGGESWATILKRQSPSASPISSH